MTSGVFIYDESSVYALALKMDNLVSALEYQIPSRFGSLEVSTQRNLSDCMSPVALDVGHPPSLVCFPTNSQYDNV